MRHYKKLDKDFDTPEQCVKYYNQESEDMCIAKIRLAAADPDSILGTYYRVNPELRSPEIYQKPLCIDADRKILTQYRVGSHYLRIHKGRIHDEQRHTRLCRCGIEKQTIDHMLFSCPNTENVRQVHGYTHLDLATFFNTINCAKLCDILKCIKKLE